LIIHHVRKGESDDAHDDVSGTNGIAGAADGTLVLRRVHGRPDATLHITGRDVEESELGLSFDCGEWRHIGTAAEVRASSEQNEILAVIRRAGSEGATVAEIGDETGKQRRNIAKLLSKLAAAGLVRRRAQSRLRTTHCATGQQRKPSTVQNATAPAMSATAKPAADALSATVPAASRQNVQRHIAVPRYQTHTHI
jgi:hypothetical protein